MYRRARCVELLGRESLRNVLAFARVRLIHVRNFSDVPDAVAKPYCAHATHTTMLLKWKYPFDDGIVIDNFEVKVVQLPDAFIPIAQAEEAADRKAAELAAMFGAEYASASSVDKPETLDVPASSPAGSAASASAAGEDGTALPSSQLDLDALVPHIHTVGHRCEYLVTDSAPYTAFRICVRAHSMAGWGPWGKWSLATTKRASHLSMQLA